MQNPKRQEIPSGLWVVATPIGNLDDLGPRARQALEEADALLCEDTRRTAGLLSALGIPGAGRLERFDAHADGDQVGRIVERLAAGARLAIVTDAGTPGVSDPGAALVAAARAAGITVVPIPGASAPVTLLSAAGLAGTAFCFRGFFPRKRGDRDAELAAAAGASAVTRIFVWFEAPARIIDTLAAVATFAPDARVVAAKELTKLHERFFSGVSGAVVSQVTAEIEREGERGEWCFAVEFAARARMTESDSSIWFKTLHCLRDAGIPASEAARQVSRHFDVRRSEVYAAAMEIFGKKSPEGG